MTKNQFLPLCQYHQQKPLIPQRPPASMPRHPKTHSKVIRTVALEQYHPSHHLVSVDIPLLLSALQALKHPDKRSPTKALQQVVQAALVGQQALQRVATAELGVQLRKVTVHRRNGKRMTSHRLRRLMGWAAEGLPNPRKERHRSALLWDRVVFWKIE